MHYNKLKNYNNFILDQSIKEQETGEEDENGNKKKKYYKILVYLNGFCIDTQNLGRIELREEYVPSKNRYIYQIYIEKKYPSPNEDGYIIPFKDEEDRDIGFEILVAKLKNLDIEIY